MLETDRFARIEIESLADLERWLSSHHAQEESVWIVRYKKSVPAKYVDRLDVLDVLLCFGWVDGLARRLDDDRTMQLISRRRQQAWAKSYKDRAERLIEAGRMRPPGLAAILESQTLGLWDAYSESDQLIVPDDLRNALADHPPAEAFFDTSAPSYRRNVLRWIGIAKQDTTRRKRINATVSLSAKQEKVPQM